MHGEDLTRYFKNESNQHNKRNLLEEQIQKHQPSSDNHSVHQEERQQSRDSLFILLFTSVLLSSVERLFIFGLIPLEKYFFSSPCPLLQNKKAKRRRLPGEISFLKKKKKSFSSFRTKHLLFRNLSLVLLTYECSAKYEPLKWIGGLQLGLVQSFPCAIWHWNLKATRDF